MSKLGPILLDGAILFTVSTAFVVATSLAFSTLERNKPVDDPIVTAIVQNDAKTVDSLAAAGPTATSHTDEQGRTVLMRAAYANYSDPTRTAAADTARAAMIPGLVQHGAAINARDHDGWTPLMWAAWSGMPVVAEKFLALGAAPDSADNNGDTPLIVAAQMGRANVVKLLLAKGAAKSAATHAHLTALDAATAGLKQNPANRAAYEQIIGEIQHND